MLLCTSTSHPGFGVGGSVGAAVGEFVGAAVGEFVGAAVGEFVGGAVGALLGEFVGAAESDVCLIKHGVWGVPSPLIISPTLFEAPFENPLGALALRSS